MRAQRVPNLSAMLVSPHISFMIWHGDILFKFCPLGISVASQRHELEIEQRIIRHFEFYIWIKISASPVSSP
jgi:hypothetical protein